MPVQRRAEKICGSQKLRDPLVETLDPMDVYSGDNYRGYSLSWLGIAVSLECIKTRYRADD